MIINSKSKKKKNFLGKILRDAPHFKKKKKKN